MYKPPMKLTFSEQLKKARTTAGLTIAEAAALVQVSVRSWAYYEAGQFLPPSAKDAPPMLTRERLMGAMKRAGGRRA